MANKMLIDAAHPEETRVVVVRGNRIEEFDFESANKKQLRGNIYLAKVTRVEPSLQAAFVEYGGNRHGFLAFSEIHPDYYQIPTADREALLAEDARAEREAEEEDHQPRRSRRQHGRARSRRPDPVKTQELDFSEDQEHDQDQAHAHAEHEGLHAQIIEGETVRHHDSTDHDEAHHHEPHAHEQAVSDHDAQAEPLDHHDSVAADHHEAPHGEDHDAHDEEAHSEHAIRFTHQEHDEQGFASSDEEDEDDSGADEEDSIEHVGAEDAMEEVPERPRHFRRQYKIQEVIKRRQILLVQVVKEERGNKGAALTTYLSLAGRYSVLMPNSGRGGGISRKITNAMDRKRLKTIAQDLEVPDGMGVILRTAGAARTKQEIRRDFEYLMRLWENVRELTLQSTAPSLVYEEGSLVKRSIRDLYHKDIDEVIVSGDAGFKEAKDFMRMLMPSHAKNVKYYREQQPVFARYGVEAQLDAMFSNQVTLRSGGYIVINQTEALVAIDVNSGRATREHNIEDTALKTNLEAADEVARQLRLRDLAGLVVIDFIDMEEHRNNRSVERRLKDALKNDRARIQVGRISPFGLMEMSRQRIRTGVLEGSTILCPHCSGVGFVRATASVALHVLRAVEEHLLRSSSNNLTITTRSEVALYILNQKRGHVSALEYRFGVTLTILADDTQTGTHAFQIAKGELATPVARITPGIQVDSVIMPDEDDDLVEDVLDEDSEDQDEDEFGSDESRAASDSDADGDGENGRRRRRRRRRRGGRLERTDRPAFERPMSVDAPQPDIDGVPFNGETYEMLAGDGSKSSDDAAAAGDADAQAADQEGRGRRRGRRGGRRLRRDRDSTDAPLALSHDDDHSGESPVAHGYDADMTDIDPDHQPVLMFTHDASALTSAQDHTHDPVSVETEKPAPRARRGRPSRRVEAQEESTPLPHAEDAHGSVDVSAPFVVSPVETAPTLAPIPVSVPVSEPVIEVVEPAVPAQPETTEAVIVGAENKPRRGGWWSRKS